MKTLLLAFTFVAAGLSASAGTKEIKKNDLSKSHVALHSSPTAFSIIFNCGGYSVEACCFGTYMDALFYATFARPCETQP